jgi:hypothetical protein
MAHHADSQVPALSLRPRHGFPMMRAALAGLYLQPRQGGIRESLKCCITVPRTVVQTRLKQQAACWLGVLLQMSVLFEALRCQPYFAIKVTGFKEIPAHPSAVGF